MFLNSLIIHKKHTYCLQVTALNLDAHFIGKFTGLESLVNLRWASFNKNCITKLEGIESCSHLEELSIQDNCLYKLDGMVDYFLSYT